MTADEESVRTPDTSLISEDIKVYVARHLGLAGSATWRELQREGYSRLVERRSSELDLRERAAAAGVPGPSFARETTEAVRPIRGDEVNAD